MGLTVRRQSVSQRLRLLWGKMRRLYLGVFRLRYVRGSHARRRGECARCGACCALGYRCLSLRDNGRGTECAVHRLRPPNCRLFPIDERDLADRNLIHPAARCGFWFGGHPRTPTDGDPLGRG